MIFVLVVLLVTSIHSLVINMTMIERWEVERHEAVIQRSKKLGGYVDASDGRRVRVKRQEFPYDIGMLKNLVQGMGTMNVRKTYLTLAPGLFFSTDILYGRLLAGYGLSLSHPLLPGHSNLKSMNLKAHLPSRIFTYVANQLS
jgi:hypothetical protein